MLTTLTVLTLTGAILAPIQDDPASGRSGRGQIPNEARVRDLMESNLGFTIYEPKALDVKSLIRYASELSTDKVTYFFDDPRLGRIDVGSRRRFIAMGDVIGVQDFKAGRDAAMVLLADLDARLGATVSKEAETDAAPDTQMRTLRMRALDLQTAAILVNNVAPDVGATLVEETGTIVLRGPAESVARAEALLMEIDQPLPQITLRCTLIQAVDESDPKATEVMGGDVARSLSELMPGKKFKSIGSLLLRGSAGGNARFEVSSSLPSMGGSDSKTPARVTWSAVARGLDPKTKTLTLDNCRMLLELPTFQTTTNGVATQTNFAGYRSEGMTADLALRADETTVVGSLGGNPIYLSMSFTIED